MDRPIQGNREQSRAPEFRCIALPGIPEVCAGNDLAKLILVGVGAAGEVLIDGDVIVIAHKVVSKAEGRVVALDSVHPSPRARELASRVDKDPRLLELILQESREILRCRSDVIIVEHRLGFVMANAGIDRSNVAEGAALLLPENPDATCARIRGLLKRVAGADVAVVINDSHGRVWRNGTVGVALGVAGMPAVKDLRGRPDRNGRPLMVTEIALADEVAAAASLLMGQADEGRPVILARGIPYDRRDGSARELIRARELDLFR